MSLQTKLADIHRRRRDDKRRDLAELENFAERLRGDATRLLADAARQSRLRHSLAEVEGRIAAARAALAAAEQELQRHEAAEARSTGLRSTTPKTRPGESARAAVKP